MRWNAETNFAKIDKGTSFLIFQNGYVEGTPPAKLAAGTEILVRNNYGALSAKIVAADDREAILEMPDGSRWRMTPRQPDEIPVGITWQGGPTQEWVIRDNA